MSKRYFYFLMLWDLCCLCLGVIDIYRYIVCDNEIIFLICGSVIIPVFLFCIYHVIEERIRNEKERAD